MLKCYPETGYFCALELPWYRVFVVRYGLTLAFVTKANVKPYLSTKTRYEGSSKAQKYPVS